MSQPPIPEIVAVDPTVVESGGPAVTLVHSTPVKEQSVSVDDDGVIQQGTSSVSLEKNEELIDIASKIPEESSIKTGNIISEGRTPKHDMRAEESEELALFKTYSQRRGSVTAPVMMNRRFSTSSHSPAVIIPPDQIQARMDNQNNGQNSTTSVRTLDTNSPVHRKSTILTPSTSTNFQNSTNNEDMSHHVNTTATTIPVVVATSTSLNTPTLVHAIPESADSAYFASIPALDGNHESAFVESTLAQVKRVAHGINTQRVMNNTQYTPGNALQSHLLGMNHMDKQTASSTNLHTSSVQGFLQALHGQQKLPSGVSFQNLLDQTETYQKLKASSSIPSFSTQPSIGGVAGIAEEDSVTHSDDGYVKIGEVSIPVGEMTLPFYRVSTSKRSRSKNTSTIVKDEPVHSNNNSNNNNEDTHIQQQHIVFTSYNTNANPNEEDTNDHVQKPLSNLLLIQEEERKLYDQMEALMRQKNDLQVTVQGTQKKQDDVSGEFQSMRKAYAQQEQQQRQLQEEKRHLQGDLEVFKRKYQNLQGQVTRLEAEQAEAEEVNAALRSSFDTDQHTARTQVTADEGQYWVSRFTNLRHTMQERIHQLTAEYSSVTQTQEAKNRQQQEELSVYQKQHATLTSTVMRLQDLKGGVERRSIVATRALGQYRSCKQLLKKLSMKYFANERVSLILMKRLGLRLMKAQQYVMPFHQDDKNPEKTGRGVYERVYGVSSLKKYCEYLGLSERTELALHQQGGHIKSSKKQEHAVFVKEQETLLAPQYTQLVETQLIHKRMHGTLSNEVVSQPAVSLPTLVSHCADMRDHVGGAIIPWTYSMTSAQTMDSMHVGQQVNVDGDMQTTIYGTINHEDEKPRMANVVPPRTRRKALFTALHSGLDLVETCLQSNQHQQVSNAVLLKSLVSHISQQNHKVTLLTELLKNSLNESGNLKRLMHSQVQQYMLNQHREEFSLLLSGVGRKQTNPKFMQSLSENMLESSSMHPTQSALVGTALVQLGEYTDLRFDNKDAMTDAAVSSRALDVLTQEQDSSTMNRQQNDILQSNAVVMEENQVVPHLNRASYEMVQQTELAKKSDDTTQPNHSNNKDGSSNPNRTQKRERTKGCKKYNHFVDMKSVLNSVNNNNNTTNNDNTTTPNTSVSPRGLIVLKNPHNPNNMFQPHKSDVFVDFMRRIEVLSQRVVYLRKALTLSNREVKRLRGLVEVGDDKNSPPQLVSSTMNYNNTNINKNLTNITLPLPLPSGTDSPPIGEVIVPIDDNISDDLMFQRLNNQNIQTKEPSKHIPYKLHRGGLVSLGVRAHEVTGQVLPGLHASIPQNHNNTNTSILKNAKSTSNELVHVSNKPHICLELRNILRATLHIKQALFKQDKEALVSAPKWLVKSVQHLLRSTGASVSTSKPHENPVYESVSALKKHKAYRPQSAMVKSRYSSNNSTKANTNDITGQIYTTTRPQSAHPTNRHPMSQGEKQYSHSVAARSSMKQHEQKTLVRLGGLTLCPKWLQHPILQNHVCSEPNVYMDVSRYASEWGVGWQATDLVIQALLPSIDYGMASVAKDQLTAVQQQQHGMQEQHRQQTAVLSVMSEVMEKQKQTRSEFDAYIQEEVLVGKCGTCESQFIGRVEETSMEPVFELLQEVMTQDPLLSPPLLPTHLPLHEDNEDNEDNEDKEDNVLDYEPLPPPPGLPLPIISNNNTEPSYIPRLHSTHDFKHPTMLSVTRAMSSAISVNPFPLHVSTHHDDYTTHMASLTRAESHRTQHSLLTSSNPYTFSHNARHEHKSSNTPQKPKIPLPQLPMREAALIARDAFRESFEISQYGGSGYVYRSRKPKNRLNQSYKSSLDKCDQDDCDDPVYTYSNEPTPTSKARGTFNFSEMSQLCTPTSKGRTATFNFSDTDQSSSPNTFHTQHTSCTLAMISETPSRQGVFSSEHPPLPKMYMKKYGSFEDLGYYDNNNHNVDIHQHLPEDVNHTQNTNSIQTNSQNHNNEDHGSIIGSNVGSNIGSITSNNIGSHIGSTMNTQLKPLQPPPCSVASPLPAVYMKLTGSVTNHTSPLTLLRGRQSGGYVDLYNTVEDADTVFEKREETARTSLPIQNNKNNNHMYSHNLRHSNNSNHPLTQTLLPTTPLYDNHDNSNNNNSNHDNNNNHDNNKNTNNANTSIYYFPPPPPPPPGLLPTMQNNNSLSIVSHTNINTNVNTQNSVAIVDLTVQPSPPSADVPKPSNLRFRLLQNHQASTPSVTGVSSPHTIQPSQQCIQVTPSSPVVSAQPTNPNVDLSGSLQLTTGFEQLFRTTRPSLTDVQPIELDCHELNELSSFMPSPKSIRTPSVSHNMNHHHHHHHHHHQESKQQGQGHHVVLVESEDFQIILSPPSNVSWSSFSTNNSDDDEDCTSDTSSTISNVDQPFVPIPNNNGGVMSLTAPTQFGFKFT